MFMVWRREPAPPHYQDQVGRRSVTQRNLQVYGTEKERSCIHISRAVKDTILSEKKDLNKLTIYSQLTLVICINCQQNGIGMLPVKILHLNRWITKPVWKPPGTYTTAITVFRKKSKVDGLFYCSILDKLFEVIVCSKQSAALLTNFF